MAIKPQKINERIKKVFCPDCSHKRKCKDEGVLYDPCNGGCGKFEWVSEKRKKEYEKEVREAQAVTAKLLKEKTKSNKKED